MSDFGLVKDDLRIKAACHRKKRNLNLSKASYSEKLLERFKMSDSKHVEPLIVLPNGDKTEKKLQ